MDNPVAMIRHFSTSDTWYYYYADAQGSVRMLTDAGGVIKESYTYDVYGRPRVMRSSGADGNWLTEDVATYANSYITIGNRFMFTGREWDSTTSLYYYRFRDYSPTLGRFLQPDPAKYIDGMNLYAYCGNNPVNWIDPWGLDKKAMEEEKKKIIEDFKKHSKDPKNPLNKKWPPYRQCFTHADHNAEFVNGQNYKYWRATTTMGSWNRGLSVLGYPLGQLNHTVTLVQSKSDYAELGGKNFILDSWLWDGVQDEEEWIKKWPVMPGESIN